MAQLLDHLHVVFHTLFDALRLDIVAQFLKIGYLLHEVVLNMTDGDGGLLFSSHKEVGWVELVFVKGRQPIHGHGVQFLDGINLIVPEGDAQNDFVVCHGNIYRVAFDPETTAFQFYIVAHIKCRDESAKECIAV